MRNSFLPFSPPFLGEEEIAEVVDTLRSDWITTGFCAEEQGCRGAEKVRDTFLPFSQPLIAKRKLPKS